MTDPSPDLIERARRVLVDEGADSEGGWHSWRCFDRERYPEPCGCTAEVARAILEDVADDIRAEALEGMADELHRLDDGRTGGYYDAGRHIIARLRERAAKLRGADQ